MFEKVWNLHAVRKLASGQTQLFVGVPCFLAGHADIDELQALVEQTPETLILADVEAGVVTAGTARVAVSLPPALRNSFLSGPWNPTAILLDRFDEVRAVAARLPYLTGF